MLKSKPTHLAPPIPHTLELDEHTRHFFDPSEWSGPVDARFKLADPAFRGMVFIGRLVRHYNRFLRDSPLRLVLQRVTRDSGNDGRGTCLVSPFSIDVDDVMSLEHREGTRQYFARHLSYPDRTNTADWRSRVPTLGGLTANSGLRRLHFDSAAAMGFDFHESGCSILDRGAAQMLNADIRPGIELGAALFGFEAPPNAERAFVEMGDALFHERAQALLDDPECALHHCARFHRMNEEERSQYAFGCGEATVERTFEMLHLALTLELGVGGALDSWAEATWHPWNEDRIIGGNDAQGRGVGVDVLPPLRDWQSAIEQRMGCRLNDEIQRDAEGLHTFARNWAGSFQVTVERPSAHELVEAELSLREMLK